MRISPDIHGAEHILASTKLEKTTNINPITDSNLTAQTSEGISIPCIGIKIIVSHNNFLMLFCFFFNKSFLCVSYI